MRRTKIICTLGPASHTPAAIEKLMKAGMNAARFNFSHGTQSEHATRIATVKRLRAKLGLGVACILDTAGPSIRTGPLMGGQRVDLITGRLLTITGERVPGTARLLSIPGVHIERLVKRGSRVFIADGLIELHVERVRGSLVDCRVVIGGNLGEHKNVNILGADVNVPAITAKDKSDVAFGVKLGVDFVAMSFVKSATDIHHMRQLIGRAPVGIIAKIEHPRAVQNLDEIIASADAVMVARGDLGVQMPTEEVPLLQKRIIQKCREASKPVIVATQMLESMTANPRPTRAEASDVANAVLDGADVVMLSGETASGAYPLQALSMMDKICRRAETLPIELRLPHHHSVATEMALSQPVSESNAAIARAAVGIAHDVDAAAILTPTESGATATRVSHYRPRVPIVAFSPNASTVYQLALTWGVDALHYHSPGSSDAMMTQVTRLAKARGYAVDHKPFVVTAGVPLGVQGSTNLVKVVRT